MTLAEAIKASYATGCMFWRHDPDDAFRYDRDYGEMRRLDEGRWYFMGIANQRVWTTDDVLATDWNTRPYKEYAP